MKSIPEKIASLAKNARRSEKLMERYKVNKEDFDRYSKDAYHMKRFVFEQARGITNPGVQSRSNKRKSKYAEKESKEALTEEVRI